MEDLAVIAVGALIMPMALFIADLFGLVMGLGWRHYSRKWKAKRASKQKLKDAAE